MPDVLPPELRALLASYRSLLEARFGGRLVGLRLFGSRARGDADVDSDVDVAVMIDGVDDGERSTAIDLAFIAWRRDGRGGPMLSPLVWAPDDLATRLSAGRRIALDILREGIAV